MTPASPLLSVRRLSMTLAVDDGVARVLDEVDLDVGHGEIVGLVGESGCGKSTLVKAILGVAPSSARIVSGDIVFDDQSLPALSDREMSRRIRARRIGFVPQDPFQSFNPLFTLGSQIRDLLKWRGAPATRGASDKRIADMLVRVGISDPLAALRRYPHQLSGGQLQRLMIASALLCEPALILADEPTSALDVTTQQQILLLIQTLARETGAALLLVTHDLGLVAQFCDRAVVMYAGQSVEAMPAAALVSEARHPYTRLLVDCHPDREGALRGIPGIVPALRAMPPGCRFNARCPSAMPGCSSRPPHVDIAADWSANCWALGRETDIARV